MNLRQDKDVMKFQINRTLAEKKKSNNLNDQPVSGELMLEVTNHHDCLNFKLEGMDSDDVSRFAKVLE